MKFKYIYKTSDGVRHESEIDATNRDAAFSELRKQGIRPIKVIAGDGTKANGAVYGIRKRVVAAIAVLVAVVAAVVAFSVGALMPRGLEVLDTFDSPMRRQIIGDAAIIEDGIRTAWKNVFSSEAEQFLSAFAIPGQQPAVVKIDPQVLEQAIQNPNTVAQRRDPSQLGALESRQIVAIVNGMKDELRGYVADGGTIEKYCARLLRRQLSEVQYYQRAQNEIENAKKRKMPQAELRRLWEQRNEELRQMGIRLVPMPE